MLNDTGLTVFVSSTYTDLAAERAVVIEVATSVGFRVAAAEYAAAEARPEDSIAAIVTSADAFVLILGFRYGYRMPGGKSGPEAEYEAARAAGMPILVFMLDEAAPWPISAIATGKEFEAIRRFRAMLLKQHHVILFTSAADLKAQALPALLRLAQHAPGPDSLETSKERATPDQPENLNDVILEIRSQLAFLIKRALEPKEVAAPSSVNFSQAARFLGPAAETVDSTKVFVIMPYSQTWSEGVEALISQVCVASGFRPEIAKYSDGRLIIHDIWNGITGSAVVIADLTGANANVAYEVGLSDAIGREAILLTQTVDVPVDFRGARLIVYENSIPGSHRLREELQNRLIAIRDRMDASSSGEASASAV